MRIQYLGIKEINGPLIVLDGVKNAHFDEMADIVLDNGEVRHGRVIRLDGEKAVIQMFEGTNDMSLTGSRTSFTGKPMQLNLSDEILGRIFDGAGRPIDGLGPVYCDKKADINGASINPVARRYPNDFICTGISSIDMLMTLIRGQKLPIFSGSGIPHDRLAVQIATGAGLKSGSSNDFAIVFAAMGVKNDVADFFRREFKASGAGTNLVMFLNLANDPIIERIVTPRCALTAAEYLAFEKGKQVLVIMTDISAYAEALRELSASKGEIPARKGFPGYLYSDFASLYERAGMIKGKEGSVTLIPILTMPNDDITHPIPASHGIGWVSSFGIVVVGSRVTDLACLYHTGSFMRVKSEYGYSGGTSLLAGISPFEAESWRSASAYAETAVMITSTCCPFQRQHSAA